MKEHSRQDDAAKVDENSKDKALEASREDFQGTYLTTDQGIPIPDTNNSLKAGTRGPTLLEDFHFREKMMRFDHERIPERAVHARGSAAHGYFQVYEPLTDLTRAAFLQDPSVKTPVFVRFSTVVGSRGAADTARDVRGFATKFYTSEGNFDLVGNNIPVFFIQDGIKFPDLIHAVKPEPHHEMPQGASAHDTFYDFASLTTETTHMLLWVLSDRGLPRSYRMMEGFGVHTFRLINAQGKSRFVKFHWKPLLGVHSLMWDESQKLSGKDSDFHRRDLWDAIEGGDFAEYELGIQVVEEEDEFKFDFDLLDATKLIPEELVPVRRVGKMVLNRNPDNFFAETEQVAYCVQNVVPGIGFTNDPMMQARLFSYLDTQLTRLGGPNFAEIPINRPVSPVHNHQQEGHMQQRIPRVRANYHPNTLGGGCPVVVPEDKGGFVHYAQKVSGEIIRDRSKSFSDHYSQATLFWNSQSEPEKDHIVKAARFELSKVESKEIRKRIVDQFSHVDMELARRVAEGIGVPAPGGANGAKGAKGAAPAGAAGAAGQNAAPAGAAGQNAAPAGAAGQNAAPAGKDAGSGKLSVDRSPALSMAGTVKDTIKSRKIAILAADGVSSADITKVKDALKKAGAHPEVISTLLDPLKATEGDAVEVDKNFLTVASIMYDAVLVPGGAGSAKALLEEGDALHFINEAYKHAKPIGAIGSGVDLLSASHIKGVKLSGAQSPDAVVRDKGVVTVRTTGDLGSFIKEFIQATAEHRHWERATAAEAVPA